MNKTISNTNAYVRVDKTFQKEQIPNSLFAETLKHLGRMEEKEKYRVTISNCNCRRRNKTL